MLDTAKTAAQRDLIVKLFPQDKLDRIYHVIDKAYRAGATGDDFSALVKTLQDQFLPDADVAAISSAFGKTLSKEFLALGLISSYIHCRQLRDDHKATTSINVSVQDLLSDDQIAQALEIMQTDDQTVTIGEIRARLEREVLTDNALAEIAKRVGQPVGREEVARFLMNAYVHAANDVARRHGQTPNADIVIH